jgi:hypothetical protein
MTPLPEPAEERTPETIKVQTLKRKVKRDAARAELEKK